MVPKAPQEGEAGQSGAPAQKGRWSGRGAENARMSNRRARPPATLPNSYLESLQSRLLIPKTEDSQSPLPAVFPLDRIYTPAALLFFFSSIA